MLNMTPDQFDALAVLIHLRQSASRDAARMVLVDGLSVIEAAAQAGITQQGANQAVLRCRRAIDLAWRVLLGPLMDSHKSRYACTGL